MNPAAQNSGRSNAPAPTATYKVRFGRRNGTAAESTKAPLEPTIPRVTRLLALANRIDGMIHSGELRDWAEAARLIGVTRARMTQVANLLLLAPEIQEAVLSVPAAVQGQDPFTERNLHSIVVHAEWECQRGAWKGGIRSFPNPDTHGPEYS